MSESILHSALQAVVLAVAVPFSGHPNEHYIRYHLVYELNKSRGECLWEKQNECAYLVVGSMNVVVL
jgi:uncharacterized protein (UPF0248 family)